MNVLFEVWSESIEEKIAKTSCNFVNFMDLCNHSHGILSRPWNLKFGLEFEWSFGQIQIHQNNSFDFAGDNQL